MVKLSHQIGGPLTGPEYQTLRRTERPGLQIDRRHAFTQVFLHLPGSLEHFAKSHSIPWNEQPLFVHS